jgi:hypothetical protein
MKVKVFKLPDNIFVAEYIKPRKFYMSEDEFFIIQHQDPELVDDAYSSQYFTFEVTIHDR